MENLVRNLRLDQDGVEAIALASTRDLRLIVDGKEARNVAASAEVNLMGTAEIIAGDVSLSAY